MNEIEFEGKIELNQKSRKQNDRTYTTLEQEENIASELMKALGEIGVRKAELKVSKIKIEFDRDE